MHCSKCGKENTDASIFCFSCGNKLAEKAPEKAAPVDAPTEAPKSCSKCGKENTESALFCATCGNNLSTSNPGQINSVNQEVFEFKKVNILLVILYSVISFGIYLPVWFLKRRDAINKLQSTQKLGKGIFIFVIIAYAMNIALVLLSAYTISKWISIVAAIILIVQAFKVRRILNDHFNVYLKKDIKFSGPATFFFNIWYLQYKINKL